MTAWAPFDLVHLALERHPEAIAGLGPVLVLDIPAQGAAGETPCCCQWLSAACEAQRLRLRIVLTPEVLHEELIALDADGRPRVRVVRLPESDYHGWERAGAMLNAQMDDAGGPLAPAARGTPAPRRWT